MQETIENGIGDRGVTDPSVPVLDGELICDGHSAVTHARVYRLRQML
jgi:hypothetical protein